MLFHNAYEMSTTSTPTRVGRGMLVPGIDTRATHDKSATALAYAGLHTPPQSAHESRRPSLAYSAPSEPSFSASSSMTTFSQPPTPIHDMKHMDISLSQSWSEGMPTNVHATQAPVGCSIAQMQDAMYHSAFSQRALYDATGVENVPAYSLCQPNSFDAFGVPAPMVSPMRDGMTQSHPPGYLRAPMFPANYGLGQDSGIADSYYSHTPPVTTSSGLQLMAGYQPTISAMPAAIFQNPQVVMPSQLNPHDEGFMEPFSSPHHREHDMNLSRSFDSTSTGYIGWESVGPQSPDDAYFGPSDEDEYVEVKREEPFTPSRGSSVSFAPTGVHAARAKRRSARRGRRSQTSPKVWASCFKHNMIISYEGKPWTWDNNGQVVTEETRDTKPHKCVHKDENGKACGRRFERSEHLKRHMGMHTDERRFPCPLPGCGKKIGRPDNATDHFKTHLRPPSKGKRNKHCEMKYLEVCIADQYPEQQAAKLIANLKKWKDAEDSRRQNDKDLHHSVF